MNLLRSLISTPSRNLDLIAVFGLALLLTPLVPTENPLARPDLGPWVTLILALAAVLRAYTLGDPVLPSLTPSPWQLGLWLHRVARVLGPVTLLAWFDAAAQRSIWVAYTALALTALTVVCRGIGSRHGLTAWRPRSSITWMGWVVRGLLCVVVACIAGLLGGVVRGTALVWLPISVFVGLLFVAVGLAEDRMLTRAQRIAAGRRDGRAHWPSRHRYVLAALGPSSGLLLLLWLHEGFIGPVGFAQAPVVALHLLAWTGILFPTPPPVAVSCILHEVVPIGGKDKGAKPGTVLSFDAPPQGALRIDPVAIKRLRVLHHWVVPVRDARIEVLDDPTRPLWPRRPSAIGAHVLGEPSFEPDRSGSPQTSHITVRLKEQLDVGTVHEANAQQRRFVVLRPFSSVWNSLRRVARTYRWDPSLPADALTVLDASTSSLILQDGDIIVLSTEGVARAFELEIGASLHARDVFGRQRPPQLEDYVGVG